MAIRDRMSFELVRIGWPNSVAILALALLPVMAMSGVGKPLSAAGLTFIRAATSCPATGEALALLNTAEPAPPPARS